MSPPSTCGQRCPGAGGGDRHGLHAPALAALQGAAEDDLVEALDEAVSARLLTEPAIGSYRFSHALIRSTLYDELGLTARVRMHRRVGEAIESLHPDDVRALAHHFTLAAGRP